MRLPRAVTRGRLARPRHPATQHDPTAFERTIDDWATEIIESARPYTMTSTERLVAVIDAVSYVVARGVGGALVECGVWRGGSILTMIRTLQHFGADDRDVYLFDTFDGMTAPTDEDTSSFDGSARTEWEAATEAGEQPWQGFFRAEVFNLDDLRAMLAATGYPEARLHFVQGPVEETLPAQAPAEVALLRLDTDWYESTRHEMEHLYPRLVDNGVLIVDDYGHWDGARRAVDEHFAAHPPAPLLQRVDYTCRMGVKP